MTTTLIRSTLWSLYKRRTVTVQKMRAKGLNMREQSAALNALRIQLEASEHWSLESHMKMVAGMRREIGLLLTVTFIREANYRKRITDMIEQCQAVQQPTLF